MKHIFLSIELSNNSYGQSATSFCINQLKRVIDESVVRKRSSNLYFGIGYINNESFIDSNTPTFIDYNKPWVLLDGEIENLCDFDNEITDRIHQPQDEINPNKILILYKNHGIDFLKKLKGRFSLLIVEPESQAVILFRSSLGQLPLYYKASEEQILVSSEERAIIAHPRVITDSDESILASIFSLSTNHPAGHTSFSQVNELLPGECLIWKMGVFEQKRIPLLLGQSLIRYRSDQEYTDHYREIIERMVMRCLPEVGPVGIMLSSGIDSAPAAAIAARQLKKKGQTLTAYSWSLPGFDTADESAHIRQVAAFADIPLNLVSASDRWPLYNRDNLHITVNSPLSNGFQGLKDSVMEKAADDGCRVILNGWFGDRLFMFSQRLLVEEAFRNMEMGLALGELLYWMRQKGLKGIWERLASIMQNSQSKNIAISKPWLTEFSRKRLTTENWPPEAEQHRHPDHFRSMISPGNFQFGSYGKASFGRFGIEQRDLYRDEELIDFMLSIPLTQFMRFGQTKFIARNAAKGLIPENIRLQPRVGVLDEFYEYGIWKKERAWLQERLFDTQCSWDKYVDRGWLAAQFKLERPPETASLVAWQCLTYELWLEKVKELQRQKTAIL